MWGAIGTWNRFYVDETATSHAGGPSPCRAGWLYLAYDYRHLNQTKIGITTRRIFTRIRESTTNPCYVLFAAFYVPDHSQLKSIEQYLSWKLKIHFIPHPSGVESEWGMGSPSDILGVIVELIPNVLAIDMDEGEYDFTKTIYLPKVNPYADAIWLADEKFEEYLRFAAPELYLEELRQNVRRWDARPNFLAEVTAMGPYTPLVITGPKVLLDRINYDIARRDSF